jgi:hypothetical protein
VDKPGAQNIKIKLSSHITEYPFRYTFNCGETLNLKGKNILDLTGWFSFLISKRAFPTMPEHEYFFEFEHTDSYNFQLEFNQPVTIENGDLFTRKISNEYFEFESGIIQNSESSYLLRAMLVVKQGSIPPEKMELLSGLLTQLEELNSFVLRVVKKV